MINDESLRIITSPKL